MTRVRLTVEARRDEILRAAAKLIDEHGVGALRIADVAAELRVSAGLIAYHFETKEKLIAAAFAHAAEADLTELRRILDDPGVADSALSRLRAAVRWYAPTDKAGGWRLWVEGWAVALREPILREVSAGLDRCWREALAAVIEEGVAAGEFVCGDPVAATWRLTALLDGLAAQMTVHPGVLRPETVRGWIDRALREELGITDRAGGS